MIFVSHSLAVNGPHPVRLTVDDLWRGLELKANNALPFVAAITDCRVTARLSDTVFDRDIVLRGQALTERVTLEEPRRVVFTRTAGPVLGTVVNEVEGDSDDPDGLRLRFSFALVVSGVEPGSAQEQQHAEAMTADYLKAVASTLSAVRQAVAERALA